MIDTGLKEKVVLITGANNPHGIGAAVARAFAAQGSRMFLHYFRHTEAQAQHEGAVNATLPGAAFYYSQQSKPADEVLAALRKLGADAHACESDLSDASRVPRLFDEAERLLGPVEVLVNNAAYWEGDTFVPRGVELKNKLVELWTEQPKSMTAAVYDRVFAVNTRAPALMMEEFARRHFERGAQWGRIVNVSTAGADRFPSEVT